ncbi:MAG: outer membrane lipoprotein carrier protein LolA [Thermodesulfovibrionales bacterium]|nr:outer membrane lipoprotein carrier protein LolA [Thermodesulfovibrionales bacterium]
MSLITFAIFLLLIFSSYLCAFELDDEIITIQKAFEEIKDISGSFIQRSTLKDLKRTDIYKGRFYIKGEKFKWEYLGDRPQTVYVLEDKIIIYLKNDKQAFVSSVDSSPYRKSPLVLLKGLKDIKDDFHISKKDKTLVLKPKKTFDNVSRIEIILTQEKFPIKYLKIVDNLSNIIELDLRDIKINTGIKDKTFEFKPPEDVSLIKQ